MEAKRASADAERVAEPVRSAGNHPIGSRAPGSDRAKSGPKSPARVEGELAGQSARRPHRTRRCGATAPTRKLRRDCQSSIRTSRRSAARSRLDVMLTHASRGMTGRDQHPIAQSSSQSRSQRPAGDKNCKPTPSPRRDGETEQHRTQPACRCSAPRSGPEASGQRCHRIYPHPPLRKRARPGVLHVFQLGRMMTQSWWPPLLGQMPTSSSVAASIKAMPLSKALKAAEYADHVVVSDGQGLNCRPDAPEIYSYRPGVGVDHHDPAAAGRRVPTGTISSCPCENTMWNGLGPRGLRHQQS